MSVLLTSTIDIFGGFTRQELAEIIVDDRIVLMSMLVRRKPANDSQHFAFDLLFRDDKTIACTAMTDSNCVFCSFLLSFCQIKKTPFLSMMLRNN